MRKCLEESLTKKLMELDYELKLANIEHLF